jgi:chromobox protein 1
LKEYFRKIGGRPEPKGQKRKGRPSAAGTKSESGTPASSTSTKRVKAEKQGKDLAQWSPPPGSWEHDVNFIDTVEQTKDSKTGKSEKFAYLVWTNGQKTQHPLKHVYQKCPQKVRLCGCVRLTSSTNTSQMLEYYESHLVFTENADEPLNNGGDGDEANDIVMNDY